MVGEIWLPQKSSNRCLLVRTVSCWAAQAGSTQVVLPLPVMTYPSCVIFVVCMILTIVLAICGGVGFCIACAAGGCCESVDVDGKPGGDDVEAPARGGAEELPPPPKRWSSEERQQLSLAVLSLPPSGLRDVRAIVGGTESTFEVAAPAGSLGVSISRRCTLGEVRASGPLAGRVAVGDRLVSISTPGRALFTCGPTATGPDIVDELLSLIHI